MESTDKRGGEWKREWPTIKVSVFIDRFGSIFITQQQQRWGGKGQLYSHRGGFIDLFLGDYSELCGNSQRDAFKGISL